MASGGGDSTLRYYLAYKKPYRPLPLPTYFSRLIQYMLYTTFYSSLELPGSKHIQKASTGYLEGRNKWEWEGSVGFLISQVIAEGRLTPPEAADFVLVVLSQTKLRAREVEVT